MQYDSVSGDVYGITHRIQNQMAGISYGTVNSLTGLTEEIQWLPGYIAVGGNAAIDEEQRTYYFTHDTDPTDAMPSRLIGIDVTMAAEKSDVPFDRDQHRGLTFIPRIGWR